MRYSDLYTDEGLMTSHWASNGGEEMAKKAHERASRVPIPDDYKLTPGLRQALRLPMEHSQAAHKFPWAIIIPLPNRKRKQLKYTFLSEAIRAHHELVLRYPSATIVSRNRGYDIPAHYRGRLPRPWKWCPFCMKPRKYRPLLNSGGQRQIFVTLRKEWSEEKERWVDKERELLLMACPVCGQNNRHYTFRRSNQPWTITKVPKGKKRIRRPRSS